MNEIPSQRRIYEAVKARGYRDGWTPQEFFARNIAKAVEEIAEAAEAIGNDEADWLMLLHYVAKEAREWFDGNQVDEFVWVEEWAADELADVYVTLCCAAEALGELTGRDIDLADLALAKAERDVERGVR